MAPDETAPAHPIELEFQAVAARWATGVTTHAELLRLIAVLSPAQQVAALGAVRPELLRVELDAELDGDWDDPRTRAVWGRPDVPETTVWDTVRAVEDDWVRQRHRSRARRRLSRLVHSRHLSGPMIEQLLNVSAGPGVLERAQWHELLQSLLPRAAGLTAAHLRRLLPRGAGTGRLPEQDPEVAAQMVGHAEAGPDIWTAVMPHWPAHPNPLRHDEAGAVWAGLASSPALAQHATWLERVLAESAQAPWDEATFCLAARHAETTGARLGPLLTAAMERIVRDLASSERGVAQGALDRWQTHLPSVPPTLLAAVPREAWSRWLATVPREARMLLVGALAARAGDPERAGARPDATVAPSPPLDGRPAHPSARPAV